MDTHQSAHEYPQQKPDDMPSGPRLMACLLYPDVMSLDICGPLQAFASANSELHQRNLPRGYDIRLLSTLPIEQKNEDYQVVATSCGIRMVADASYNQQIPSEIDTLLVPGGQGVLSQLGNSKLIDWIKYAEPMTRRLGSICSGALLLAKTGLLDGKVATTHWQRAEQLKQQHPRVKVEANRLHTYAPDGINGDSHIFTSAGVTAGVDLALALIEDDFDRSLALAVARNLVMFFKRPGGQNQFSELLMPDINDERLGRLLEWIGSHLSHELTLEAVALQANMTPRSLSRLFVRELGTSPGSYIERIRIETARTLMEEGHVNISTVARLTGFGHPDSLRRQFHKHFDISPSEYQKRFGQVMTENSQG